MGKISLKGNFVFSGSGKLTGAVNPIKVLKQLGDKLFVCGDRSEPEQIYQIPADKNIVFARIDSTGAGFDDWNVAVFLRHISLEYDPNINYNQQNQREGTEIVFLSKDMEETFVLLPTEETLSDNKIYTGNHSFYQLEIDGLIYAKNVTIKVNNWESTTEVEDDHDNSMGRRQIFDNNDAIGIQLIVNKFFPRKSSGAYERGYFYESPHHHTKGIYSSKNEPSATISPRTGLPFPQRGMIYHVQVFEKKEKDVNTLVQTTYDYSYNADAAKNTRVGSSEAFALACGNPGDILAFLYVDEVPWMIGTASGISWFRGYGTPCQHEVPPYPTFKASVSAIRLAKPREIWCPTFVGSGYFAKYKWGNFQFESEPPFGGSLIRVTSTRLGQGWDIGAVFEPELSSLNNNTLATGGSATTVRGRAEIITKKVPTLYGEATNNKLKQGSGIDFNQAMVDNFNSGGSSSLPLLDTQLFNGSTGETINSCTRPVVPSSGIGDGGPQYTGSDTDYGFHRGKVEEFFLSRAIIAEYIFPRLFYIIPLTNENYEDINEDVEDILNLDKGFTFRTETQQFFAILPEQKILKNDILTTKRNITEWEVTELIISSIVVGTGFQLSAEASTIEKIKTTEKVLPLQDFDKIWSYSFYK